MSSALLGSRVVRCGIVTIGIVSVSIGASAQSIYGALVGIVTDASGTVLPGVTVTVTNLDTQVSRSVVTDSVGNYQVPNLDAGRYGVVFAVSGFAEERREIVLLARQTARTDISFTLGKNFPVAGTSRAPFEMAIANVFNIENFDVPANMNITSATFGRVTRVQSVDQAGPRTVQFSLRYTF